MKTFSALKLFLIVEIFCFGTPLFAQKAAGSFETFRNPVIYADVPDMSVTRVGSDYYMISTTMHLMPGGPVMKSKDLVHWETVGYVFDKLTDTSRYDLINGTVYGRGQWASSIRYHNGQFYVLFSPNDEPFKSYIYTAKDPSGEWKLLSRMQHFHDASLFFDDDGRVYVFYGTGDLKELKSDLSDVKPGGVSMKIFERDADEQGLLEGSQVVKHNGKYYLLMISMDWSIPGRVRREVCYRADKITGPYEKKVILEHDFDGYGGVGQGYIVDSEEGDWYGVIFQDRGGIGRVPTLMPCRWIDGWPMLGDENGHVPLTMTKKTYPSANLRGIVGSDDFNSQKLSLYWQWNHNPINDKWSLTERPGYLRLKTNRIVDNLYLAPNTITQRMEGPKCKAVISMDVSKMKDGDVAGFSAFNGHSGLLSIVKEGDKKRLVMSTNVVNFDKTQNKTVTSVDVEEKAQIEFTHDIIYLGIAGDFTPGKDLATFYYSFDNKSWKQLGSETKMIFDYLRLFMGSKFAIFNYATKSLGGYVDIDFFEYTRLDDSKKEDVSFRTICNPVDLSYRFGLEAPSKREAADPSVVLFKGEYYLFLSKSGGYFHSPDMKNWTLITTDDLPIEDYAPTVEEINGTLFFTTSTGTKRIYKAIDPKQGKWELYTDSFPYAENDPAYFRDDDGKVYLYSGSSSDAPIIGMELDPKTMMPLTDFIPLMKCNRKQFGWEVWGDYNTVDQENPWLEGAFMTKYNDKYYLQYSAPGTQFKSYCDGVYVSENPLGPFTVVKHNPFAYKPEGFANGAGHGSTFKDMYGNYWHIGTVAISVRHMFERRLSLFPVFFDGDDEMYAYSGWGDYPMILPDKKISNPEELFPGWMLLSYNKKVKASSTFKGFSAQNAVNEDIRTWWSAETGNKGECLSVDFGEKGKVYAIQVNFGDQDATLFGRNDTIYYQYYLEGSDDGKNWKRIVDKSENTRDAPSEYIQLDEPIETRYLRITNVRCPSGKFSISGLRAFGTMDKRFPDEVKNLSVTRNPDDRRKVHLNWDKVEGATGYNIRFGSDKNKLYQNYLTYMGDTLSINVLDSEQPYYFVIDSFNEAGITKGTAVKEAL